MSDIIADIKSLDIKTENETYYVTDVSFDIKEGEILGIVGESGSGKTLTIKAMLGLLPDDLFYTAERFSVFGSDFNNISVKERKKIVGRNIGVVAQNTIFYLHPLIRIKNQIADGYTHCFGKAKAEGIKRARLLLCKVGFNDPERILNSYPWQLSGGMRQRVNIAMALMNEPSLIIADEPTTALDSGLQKQVVDLFKSINTETGASLLIVSHDMGLVKYVCDRVIVFYAGQILEEGLRDEVFNFPLHPYTKALISVIPSMNVRKGERLSEIKGVFPNLHKKTDGCIFYDRCPVRMEICRKSVAVYSEGGHRCRCNLYA